MASNLKNMLIRFKNGNKLSYKDGDWRLGCTVRTWDDLFDIYYKDICKFQGNTLDKEITILNNHDINLEKSICIIAEVLDDYRFTGELFWDYINNILTDIHSSFLKDKNICMDDIFIDESFCFNQMAFFVTLNEIPFDDKLLAIENNHANIEIDFDLLSDNTFRVTLTFNSIYYKDIAYLKEKTNEILENMYILSKVN